VAKAITFYLWVGSQFYVALVYTMRVDK